MKVSNPALLCTELHCPYCGVEPVMHSETCPFKAVGIQISFGVLTKAETWCKLKVQNIIMLNLNIPEIILQIGKNKSLIYVN